MNQRDGTPKSLKEAIRNAILEVEQKNAGIDAQIEIISEHIQERLAQDFSVAIYDQLKSPHTDACEAMIMRLFKRIFPEEK